MKFHKALWNQGQLVKTVKSRLSNCNNHPPTPQTVNEPVMNNLTPDLHWVGWHNKALQRDLANLFACRSWSRGKGGGREGACWRNADRLDEHCHPVGCVCLCVRQADFTKFERQLFGLHRRNGDTLASGLEVGLEIEATGPELLMDANI